MWPRRTVWTLPLWARLIHLFFLITLTGEILYATFQVFVVLQPEGVAGPILLRASEIPFEAMVVRRLYAMEAWIAFVGLAVYTALTELLPRLGEANYQEGR
ncbi:MAG: hypothetical protein ACI8PZ_002795 [Myxococcota bacterium]